MKAGVKWIVIDASITLAWFFGDESTPQTESVLTLLESDWQAIVPAIWPLEVANVFLLAARRRRVSIAQVKASCRRLEELPITVDFIEMRAAFAEVTETARQQHLTVYDGAYLELALRNGLPLATLDGNLRRAAETLGISILPA